MRPLVLFALLLPVCFASMKVLRQRPGAVQVMDSLESEEDYVDPLSSGSSRFPPYEQKRKCHTKSKRAPPPINQPVFVQHGHPAPCNKGCGYMIVETRRHMCYPGENTIKVMMRPDHDTKHGGCSESESAPVPQFQMEDKGQKVQYSMPISEKKPTEPIDDSGEWVEVM